MRVALSCALLGLTLIASPSAQAGAAPAARVPAFEAPPPPDFPPGCEPDRIRSRLASPDSADAARACGNLRMPWGYRGWIGREHAMRSYGRRGASAAWARRVALALLDSTAVDTIYRAPGLVASCRTSDSPPIYLVRFLRGGQATAVLLRFDLGVAQLFADEMPLGMVALADERADSLWALLGDVLEDDPVLRRPRPVAKDSLFSTAHATGDASVPDKAPVSIGRGGDLPPYPEEAEKKGIDGTVYVLVRVNEAGMPEDAVVHAGHPMLRDVALETVWKTRFKPARDAGRPVAAWTMVPVTYRLH